MNDQNESTEAAFDNPGDNGTGTSAACCSTMRVARAIIGTLLLTVMVGNAVVFASPELAARIGSFFSGSRSCSSGGCPSGSCCPGITSIGLPTATLESTATTEGSQESALTPSVKP